MGPSFWVTAYLAETTSVQEVSKVFEGLHSLERSGKIRLAIKAGKGNGYPRLVRAGIQNETRIQRAIAIDLADQSDCFSIADLEQVDVYFKRSLRAPAPELGAQLASKVQPFGLNNPAISLRAALRVLSTRSGTGRSARGLTTDARQLFALPSPRAFECRPEIEAEPSVLFQTRLWPAAKEDADVIALNDDRAALVRALRKAFGRRFLGGVIPTEFARLHYPDVLTELPFGMRAYPELVKRPLIGVYSRGLHDSISFKMSEYLGASRCIVAHRPEAVLPEPLVDGRNFLLFDELEGCVAQCEYLLSRPQTARYMRAQNWSYYVSQVEPNAHLLRTLNRAFADP